MTKKGLLVLVLAAAAAGGAFALPPFHFSAGGGGYFTSDFGGGVTATYQGTTDTVKLPYAGGGGFVFLDATYLEVSLGVFGAAGSEKFQTHTVDLSGSGLDIGFALKYPMVMSGKLLIFPLAGVTYRFMLSVKEDGFKVDNPEDLNSLWFKGGGGFDFYFTEHGFFRAQILYGLRLEEDIEKKLISLLKRTYPGLSGSSRLGHGLEATIALGYSF
ncbi:MAG: hypothetical protein LBG84_04890 [Treponema sp.]|jgi:hypothetical protein|nr:hypothetical protein [Treponema sp.]